MNLVDQIVLNKVYGEGRVSSQDDKYVYIAFKAGEKKFKYPEAFDIFLRLKDKDKQKNVDAYITRLKMTKCIEKRIRDDERQKTLENSKLNGKAKSNISTCVNLAFRFEDYEYEVFDSGKVKIDLIKTGKNKGKPVKLSRIQNGGLCVLTTKEFYRPEEERYVFGIFLIEDCNRTKNLGEGFVFENINYRIKLSKEESKAVKFWESDKTQKAAWNSGLHRYFENEQAIKILQKIVNIKKGTDQEILAENIYNRFCETI